jgi:hypothetical protein
MTDDRTITLDKMRPATRIGHLCVLGLIFAIPWIAINLWLRMPNRRWAIHAGELVAIAAAWLAFRALQRRARNESQATAPIPDPTTDSN